MTALCQKVGRASANIFSGERIFTDTISWAKADRPGLAEALAYGRAGDSLVVWKLDRLGVRCSTSSRPSCTWKAGDRLPLLHQGHRHHLARRQAHPHLPRLRGAGRIRTRPHPRTHQRGAGLAAARARGHQGGRPPKKAQMAHQLHQAGTGITEVCTTLGIGRTTLYHYLTLQQNRWLENMPCLPLPD